MASKAIRAKAISRGIVKAVPSGDTLVIMEMGNTASTEIPPERTIILSSLMAPKLVITSYPLSIFFNISCSG